MLTGAFNTEGGIAASNRLILRCLSRASRRLDVLSLTEGPNGTADLRIAGRTVPERRFAGNQTAFALASFRAAASGHYDLIFVDHVNLASVLSPLALAGVARYFTSIYLLEVAPPNPDLLGRLGLMFARRRIACSSYSAAVVTRRWPWLDVAVCEPALDPERFGETLPPTPESAPKDIDMDNMLGQSCRLGRSVVLHIGRMPCPVPGRRKGQHELLAAFPAIHAACPEAQLVLVGSGEELPVLQVLARSLPRPVQASIFFPGVLQPCELIELLDSSALLAMPSEGEGFGIVYIEAMSRAKPVVALRSAASPFVVRDGVNGLLLDPPARPENVSDRILSLLADATLRERLGRRGYEMVRSRYMFPHYERRFWAALTGQP